MLRFYAEDFCRAASLLGQVHSSLTVAGANPNTKSWASIAGLLGALEKHCEDLGLAATLAQIRRVKPTFVEGRIVDYLQLARDSLEIEIRINDELSSRLLLSVKPENATFMFAFGPDWDVHKPSSLEAAWTPIFIAFPGVKYDALEAFRCYGLERSTASVFHLMRVLELGLTALGAIFSVSLAHTNWAPAIEQIEGCVREMHKDPAWKIVPDVKAKQEFYAQAASHFGILKDAWRNYTAHARGRYTEQESEDIMNATRAFMRKIADGGISERVP
jgi:hypothetical protein